MKSLRDGWQLTFQSAAVVSGLLASTASGLYSFFKDESKFRARTNPDGTRTFVLILCYSSLLFSIGAVITSFILIDKLGELPFYASAKKDLPAAGSLSCSSNDILVRYGVGNRWETMVWHCGPVPLRYERFVFKLLAGFACFYLGIWSLVLLLLTYVWMQETLSTQITATFITLFAVIPPTIFIIFPSKPEDDYVLVTKKNRQEDVEGNPVRTRSQ